MKMSHWTHLQQHKQNHLCLVQLRASHSGAADRHPSIKKPLADVQLHNDTRLVTICLRLLIQPLFCSRKPLQLSLWRSQKHRNLLIHIIRPNHVQKRLSNRSVYSHL